MLRPIILSTLIERRFYLYKRQYKYLSSANASSRCIISYRSLGLENGLEMKIKIYLLNIV
jgi:hypothetical protein